jgi:hypothetical protein
VKFKSSPATVKVGKLARARSIIRYSATMFRGRTDMETQKLDLRFGVITIMILLAALSCLIPHHPNFAPIGGMALFGAAYYSRRFEAFAIPIISMWISDLAYTMLLFGAFEFSLRKVPRLALSH